MCALSNPSSRYNHALLSVRKGPNRSFNIIDVNDDTGPEADDWRLWIDGTFPSNAGVVGAVQGQEDIRRKGHPVEPSPDRSRICLSHGDYVVLVGMSGARPAPEEELSNWRAKIGSVDMHYSGRYRVDQLSDTTPVAIMRSIWSAG